MADVIEEEKVTVKQVCQDFRVREDGALASKLQEEEFQKHYVRNKSERKTVRGDVRVAKQAYLEEVKTAQLLPEQELEQLSMEETDKWLARDLQDKLHSEERKEIERQRRLAQQDAKVAKSMQHREKERFDREWHRRREERREEERLGREHQEREQRHIEQQDSEEVDEQTAIELRDARLARELQEREKELYKRERERYRYERERAKQRHERESRRERERERMDGQEIEQDHERHHQYERDRRPRERRDGHETEQDYEQHHHYERERRENHYAVQDQERCQHEREQRKEREIERVDDREREREQERDRYHHEREQRRAIERERAREREIREREWERLDEQERHRHEAEQSRERGVTDGQEMDRQREIELRDARLARELQEEEKKRFDREWQRRREMELLEEHDRRSYQRSASEPNNREIDSRRTTSRPPQDPITVNGHAEPVIHRQNRPGSGREDRRVKRQSSGSSSNSSAGSTGEERRPRDYRQPSKDIRRSPKEDRKAREEQRKEEENVVAMPTTENNGGGRIERDKIIMADGTEIHLFEDEDDKKKKVNNQQKSVEKERLKKDEEYAKMLQDQERRISEAERMAAEDRRLAMEEQDRELARHLQRKEYHRMQQERKERQMRRANSMPSDRHSVNLEDPRRLPSYAEALHRHQLPDLLPGNDPSSNRYSYVSTHSSGNNGNSLERETYNQVEREKYAAQGDTRDELQSHVVKEPEYSRLRGTDDCDHLPSRESDNLRSRGIPATRGIDNVDLKGSRDPEDDLQVVLPDNERYLSGERVSSRDRREPEGFTRDERQSPHDFASRIDDHDDFKETGYDLKHADNQLDKQAPISDQRPVDQEQRRSFPIITDFEDPENDEGNKYMTSIENSPVWKTRESKRESPSSSLERHKENAATDSSQARLSYASSGGNSTDRRSQNSGASPPREGVWERFDDDDDNDEFSVATGQSSRLMFRSQTHPVGKDSDRYAYNVVEGIDPTFRRKKKSAEDDTKENNTEERTKFMPLIKPQRRRSTDKKKSKEKKK